MATTKTSNLMRRWAALSPLVRSVLAVIALLSVVMGGIIAVGGVSNEPSEPRARTTIPNATSNLRLIPGSTDSTEKLTGKVDASQQQIADLRRQLNQQQEDQRKAQAAILSEIQKAQDGAGPGRGVNPELIEEVRRLSQELKELKTNPKLSAASPNLDEPLPNSPGRAEGAKPDEAKRPTLRSFGGKSLDKPADDSANKEKEHRILKVNRETIAYLPPGGMFDAILMNGVMAPTNSVARRNPVPMLLRVQTNAILPNNQRQDIKECFLIISGYGELASSRMLARTEVLSCILEDGRVAEAKVEGYIVGEDGKLGMQGELVSRQGQKIAQALMAGTLGGIAKGLTPFQVPQLNLGSASSSSVGALPGMDQVMQAGLAGGLADTAKMVSQFYLDTAKEMYPVISIDSLRRATIILTKGFELRA